MNWGGARTHRMSAIQWTIFAIGVVVVGIVVGVVMHLLERSKTKFDD
jgi:uncharacterized membrane-anchored protein YhcB (DUF1043 family)